MSHSDTHASLDSLIRKRKTEKILLDPDQSCPLEAAQSRRLAEWIYEDLMTAGWAPFHYPRDIEGLAEPWRAHVLKDSVTQPLAKHLKHELELSSKEPLLCAACSALVLVTWLPESAPDDCGELLQQKLNERNQEHLAAASAMVQNFLLLQTARELGTYWSSGGILKEERMFNKLGIPTSEKLLAALFIQVPGHLDGTEQRKPGAHRNRRSMDWVREIQALSLS